MLNDVEVCGVVAQLLIGNNLQSEVLQICIYSFNIHMDCYVSHSAQLVQQSKWS